MFVPLLAMVAALACAAASFERLRRVHRVAVFDLAELAVALGRNPNEARLSLMRELLVEQGPGWEGELLSDVLGAKGHTERVALVNERLGDVESDLGWGSRIPVVAACLSAMGPLCVLFFAIATRHRMMVSDIVAIVGWGGAGVVLALAAGREADRVAASIRKGVDAWVARVLDAASGVQAEAPSRQGET